MKLMDYQCVLDGSDDWVGQAALAEGIKLPEALHSAEGIARLARRVRRIRQQPFCILPFCHTVEGEALGATINFGDNRTGPRTGAYRYQQLEELLSLPPIDYDKGRMAQLLTAISILSEQGETVLLEISGPLTIFNTLIDASRIYKGMRKQRAVMQRLYQMIGEELLRYAAHAKERGVRVLSYADASAGVNLIGPTLTKEMMDDFTHEFLLNLKEQCAEDVLLHLCPKTSYALVGSERADFLRIPIEETASYGQTMMKLRGRVAIMGDRCLKKCSDRLEANFIQEVRLRG